MGSYIRLVHKLKTDLKNRPRLYAALWACNAGCRALWRLPAALRQRRQLQRIEKAVQRSQGQLDRGDDGAILFANITSGPRAPSFMMLSGLLMSWSLRLSGERIVHLVCNRGLPSCVQGVHSDDALADMPCRKCVGYRSRWFPPALTEAIVAGGQAAAEADALEALDIEALSDYCYRGIDVGRLCIPSVRWALRRHELAGVPQADELLRRFVRGAMSVVDAFGRAAEKTPLRAVVVFNGTFFPEAVLRACALRRGLPVVAYEVGYRANSIFLSHQAATAHRIDIPDDFHMTPPMQAQLDRYLHERAKGEFAMGAVRFWPRMESIGEDIKRLRSQYRRMATIFTNVIFDTSQVHGNYVFEDMFDWLDCTMRLAGEHPETLFVLRAHPDESRPDRPSRQPVAQWLDQTGFGNLPNVLFVPPSQYTSSYELLSVADFCVVYNSTIGLEAVILGKPVITAGRARYSRERICTTPADRQEYCGVMEAFLAGDVDPVTRDQQARARRYMYFSVFRAALDLSAFVRVVPGRSYSLEHFEGADLHPDNSREMRVIRDGVLTGSSFHYG